MSQIRLLAIVIVLILLSCFVGFPISTTNAQTTDWTNTTGGNFFDGSNWSNGVPDASAIARFNLSATYSVKLSKAGSADFLNIGDGDVTFFGGNSLTANSFNITDTTEAAFVGVGSNLSASIMRVQSDSRLGDQPGVQHSSS